MEFVVQAIVNRFGGAREKEIMSNPHYFNETETWDNDHKVIDIISIVTDSTGHRDSFAVDIINGNICG